MEPTCPCCKHILNANAPVEEVGITNVRLKPRPNDLSVCAYCGTILQFDEEMNPIEMSQQAIDWLKNNDRRTYNLLLSVQIVVMEKMQRQNINYN